MSITISNPTSPEGWVPSGNDIIYKVLSTEAARPNFAYLIDVYVNSNRVIQLRQIPINPTERINVNIANIVRNYISATMPASWSQSTVPDVAEAYIVVTEYYNGQPYATTTSVPVRVWDAAAQFQDVKKGVDKYIRNFTPYTAGSVHTDGRYLAYHDACSISPFERRHESELRAVVSINPFTTPMYQINWNVPQNISFFVKDGWGVTNPFVGWIVLAGFNSKGVMIKKLCVGIINDTAMGKTIYSPSVRLWSGMGGNFTYKYGLPNVQLDDFSDCTYAMLYTTTGQPTTSVTLGDTLSLRPVCFEINRCKESYSVLYKSYEGGWGQMLMNKKTESNVTTETTTKDNINPTTWDTTSRLIDTVNVKAQGKWTLNTGWIDGEKFKDVEDLIMSPEIYIVHQPDSSVNDTTKIEYIPVQIENNDYVVRETKNVNLRNYELKFTESFYRNTVRE